MSFKQYDATEDLGKTGYFPFSVYKNVTLGHVLDAMNYEMKHIFQEYISPMNDLKRQTPIADILREEEPRVTVYYGSNEGIYLNVTIPAIDRSKREISIFLCKTLDESEYHMTRCWQCAEPLYRFLNGRWK